MQLLEPFLIYLKPLAGQLVLFLFKCVIELGLNAINGYHLTVSHCKDASSLIINATNLFLIKIGHQIMSN